MFGIGMGEFILILIVGLLLFGSRLPEVAYSLGKFVRKIQLSLQDIKSDIEDEIRK
ncbi:MAG TPA: twin-arginine translocase TatA/TatE family subunit [Deltaproteobacteria bacterium]|nr:twin-arginine translocase TatA/TatE family subunit [Deltaproteobacteria bacterium]